MKFFYNTGVRLYWLAIYFAGFFNEKARKWRSGRTDFFAKLERAFGDVKQPVAWFHCASLGEFEQGRPVIEAFRQKQPGYRILLTFFSPSGYEVRKTYPGADYVFYLPLDTPANARRFLKIIKPVLAVFVKYEFWYNYLQWLNNAGVPTYLISGVFRPGHYFFKWYGRWFRQKLHYYRKIFVQDARSAELLKNAGIDNAELTGDTRFDRVTVIAAEQKSDSKTEKFKNGMKLWICGSTWDEDEKIISAAYHKICRSGEKIKLLIVPHEIEESHILRLQILFPEAIRYSNAGDAELRGSGVMVVDTVGLLSSLYRYGDIAYIGGGFGRGIHNLPEAAVYGIPVIFGTNYGKVVEAGELIRRGGGFSVATEDELNKLVLHFIGDDAYRRSCGQAAKDYILSGVGATGRIISVIAGH